MTDTPEGGDSLGDKTKKAARDKALDKGLDLAGDKLGSLTGTDTAKFAKESAVKIQQSWSDTAGEGLGARVDASAEAMGEVAARVAIEEGATRAANMIAPGVGEAAARALIKSKPGQVVTRTAEKIGGKAAKRGVKWARWLIAAAILITAGPPLLVLLIFLGMFLGTGAGENIPPGGQLTPEQQQAYSTPEVPGVSPLVAYSNEYTDLLGVITAQAYAQVTADWADMLAAEGKQLTDPTARTDRTGRQVLINTDGLVTSPAPPSPWNDTPPPAVVCQVNITPPDPAGVAAGNNALDLGAVPDVTTRCGDTTAVVLTIRTGGDGWWKPLDEVRRVDRETTGPWRWRTDTPGCHPAVRAVRHRQQYGPVDGGTGEACWTLDGHAEGFQPPATVVGWIEDAIDAQERCLNLGGFSCGNPITGTAGADTNRVLANDFYTLWLAWHNPAAHAPHHFPLDRDYDCAATFYEGRTFPTRPTVRGETWMDHLKQMNTTGEHRSVTDIRAGCADNRLLVLIGVLSARWPMHMSTLRTGHTETVGGGSVESSHHRGRAFDIWSVNKNRIRYGTNVGKDMWNFIVYELFLKDRRLGIDQLGSPFADTENIQGVFTDDGHHEHFHIAVCGVRYWNYWERANLRDSCNI